MRGRAYKLLQPRNLWPSDRHGVASRLIAGGQLDKNFERRHVAGVRQTVLKSLEKEVSEPSEHSACPSSHGKPTSHDEVSPDRERTTHVLRLAFFTRSFLKVRSCQENFSRMRATMPTTIRMKMNIRETAPFSKDSQLSNPNYSRIQRRGQPIV